MIGDLIIIRYETIDESQQKVCCAMSHVALTSNALT